MQVSGVQISQPCSLANPFCNLTEKILYFTEFLKIFSNFLLRTQTEKIPCSFYFTLSLFPHVFLNWFIKLKYPYYEVKQSKNTLKTVNSLLCPSLLTPLGYALPYYSPSSNAQSAMWLWQENVHYFTVIFFSEKWKLLVMSLQPNGLYSQQNSPGQNTRMGSLSLIQGIFPTQGSNPGLLHCSSILYQLSHKGSPRILEWVAYPFSSRSSWPGNQSRTFSIAGRFFFFFLTNWAIREAHSSL